MIRIVVQRLITCFSGLLVLMTGFMSFPAWSVTLEISPQVLRYPVTQLLASTEGTVTVSNNSGASQTISSVSLTGVSPEHYVIGTDNCTGTLADAASCTVIINFEPTRRGTKTAVLQVEYGTSDMVGSFLSNQEDKDSEAKRRLPPIIQALTIPESMNSGSTYNLTWKLLGYHQGFETLIAFFDCTGLSAGTCGDSAGDNFHNSGYLTSSGSVDGLYTFNGARSKEFDFSYSFTPDSGVFCAASTNIVVRFYVKSVIDQSGSGISLLIPGNQSTTYYDTAGRRIQKELVGAGC